MEKMKKYAAMFLAVLIAVLPCSCGGGKAVRAEVAEAYSLDADGEQLITELFEKFDAAFAELERADEITDSDLYDYADAVYEAYNSFEEEFEGYRQNLSDNIASVEGDTKEQYTDIMLEGIGLSTDMLGLSTSRTKYMIAGGSAEALSEEALNLINNTSYFFYGEYAISDDDLDRLAEKFA